MKESCVQARRGVSENARCGPDTEGGRVKLGKQYMSRPFIALIAAAALALLFCVGHAEEVSEDIPSEIMESPFVTNLDNENFDTYAI